MDFVAILNLGVIGLGFLLAVLAFRLLTTRDLGAGAIANARWFLAFSLAVCALALIGQWMRHGTMTTAQATTVAKGITAVASARAEVDKIPAMVERSCPGGSSGESPRSFPKVLNATNAAREELAKVQSALEACNSLAPPQP